ncbi:hypothetical protein HanRHA438_Chr04g0194931 [Helianthus annuus]|nr:hypothetical protein HanRHA438_Chr04g0194931 [Helianthus annuus]
MLHLGILICCCLCRLGLGLRAPLIILFEEQKEEDSALGKWFKTFPDRSRLLGE